MNQKGRSKLWASLVLTAIVLAACGTAGEDTTTTGGTVAGGTVRIGYGGAPADLNPGLGVLVEDFILYNLMYDSLLNIDLEGNFEPEVATEWSVSDDGLTWTLTIRDDITFHDG
ncbi:MAG: ABC transporter substrate-binding protein, partial [Acidimicrobiia bacterium]